MMTTQSIDGCVLVLWGNQFDALMAITFVSRLRQAGIETKLVGVHGRSAVGHRGVMLTADMTLGDAIARWFSVEHTGLEYIIVPCHSPHIGMLHNDPRISTLLSAAHKNGSRFISGLLSSEDASLFPVPIHRVESYIEPQQYGERAAQISQSRVQGEM